MQMKELPIINKLGLHARASAKFTQLAAQFESDIWLVKDGRRINGKSIMGVMMLAAGFGSTVMLEVDGADESEALVALENLVANRFGENE